MRKLFLISLMAVGLLVTAGCKKSDSVISGQITYNGAISGINYVAEGAQVTLHMGAVGQTGDSYMTTTTDQNGSYNFTGLMDGNWTVAASVTVNAFNYYGESGVVSTSGKDGVTANFELNN